MKSAGKRLAVLILSICIAALSKGHSEDWKIVKVDGVDYVTLKNVVEFYEFEKYAEAWDEKKVHLWHPNIVADFDFEKGKQMIRFNGSVSCRFTGCSGKRKALNH